MPTQDPASTDVLLQMELQPSSLLRGALILSHLFAMFALWWIDAHMLLQLGATAALLLSCRRSLLRLNDITSLCMRPGGIVLGRCDQMIAVTLEDAPWCSEWLQVLRFSVPPDDTESAGGESGAAGSFAETKSRLQRLWQRVCQRRHAPCYGRRRLSVVILPDSASAQSRRRLRVLLRWHRFSNGVPAQAGSDNTPGSRGSRMVSLASGSRSG